MYVQHLWFVYKVVPSAFARNCVNTNIEFKFHPIMHALNFDLTTGLTINLTTKLIYVTIHVQVHNLGLHNHKIANSCNGATAIRREGFNLACSYRLCVHGES